MTDNLTGPELFEASVSHLRDAIDPPSADQDNALVLGIAQVQATHALTAVLAMIAENMRDFPPYEMEAWREVLPLPPLKECKGKETRRPECADRHTEDCDYADPVPEPKHVLLPVGTRVLVSDPHARNCVCSNDQPYVGKIAGYDTGHTKYQINEERYGTPGKYYNFVRWVFADNRVQVHPDGPTVLPKPEPVKEEPTGPRVYVKNHYGKQGYVLDTRRTAEDVVQLLVQWFAPGASPVWKDQGILTIIPENEVDRCPNGQTGDECGSGENQCELCLEAEDEEGDMIEESMGLR